MTIIEIQLEYRRGGMPRDEAIHEGHVHDRSKFYFESFRLHFSLLLRFTHFLQRVILFGIRLEAEAATEILHRLLHENWALRASLLRSVRALSA